VSENFTMNQAATSNAIHYFRPRALASRWGCSTTTLWRMTRRGDLPAPTRLSAGIVGWRSDIIEACEAARTAAGADPSEAA
jgi:predicted DNA-binding transcriptional regulator AlpA